MTPHTRDAILGTLLGLAIVLLRFVLAAVYHTEDETHYVTIYEGEQFAPLGENGEWIFVNAYMGTPDIVRDATGREIGRLPSACYWTYDGRVKPTPLSSSTFCISPATFPLKVKVRD